MRKANDLEGKWCLNSINVSEALGIRQEISIKALGGTVGKADTLLWGIDRG